MAIRKRTSGPARERAVLAIGLLSSLLLAGAALAPFSDPEVAGRAALAQLAGRVADGVTAEWQRLLRDPTRYVRPAGEAFEWDGGETQSSPLARANDVSPGTKAGVSAYGALMAEAERL